MLHRLDLKDKKILSLLDQNARLSNTQIAKRVGLSKPAVEYRLKRLHKNKIIFEYYTIIDFTRLGYSQYKIYFKFQDTTLEDEKNIVDYWINDHAAVWVAQIRGKWDLAVSLLTTSNFDFGQSLSKFMKLYARFILEKDVLLTEYSPVFARKYLTDTPSAPFTYGKPATRYSLDDTDREILRILSTDARISIVDLSKKTNLTRDVVTYRLKKLVKDRIIVQYRCYLNLQNVGINHYKIILRTKNFDDQSESALKAYLDQHRKATQFLKLIGSWDLEIEVEAENEDELYTILADIRKKFSTIIRDFDILRITETYKYDYFPF